VNKERKERYQLSTIGVLENEGKKWSLLSSASRGKEGRELMRWWGQGRNERLGKNNLKGNEENQTWDQNILKRHLNLESSRVANLFQSITRPSH
jgi:PAB1-binding protein PBP1